MASFPGLELLFSSVKSKITSNYDALICFLHWNLVHRGFKCIGSGEPTSSSAQPSPKKSELLPPSWNASQEEYVLRYVQDESDDVFLLKCLVMGDTLLVNFMRMRDERVTSLSLDTDQFIDQEQLKNFDKVYKDRSLLHQLFNDDLITLLTTAVEKRSETTSKQGESKRQKQTEQRQQRVEPEREIDPLRDPLRVPQRLPGQRGNPEWGQPSDPFSIGRGDLDPFSGAGPGMLMDPFRGAMPHGGIDPGVGMPGRLPRGAVPPGARFDPIGPVAPGGPGHGPAGGFSGAPDPDHLPPPGYDDMYM